MSLNQYDYEDINRTIDNIIDEETDDTVGTLRDCMDELYNNIMERVKDALEDYLVDDNSDLNDAVRRMANRQTAPVQNNQSVTQNGVTYATTINARIQALKTYLSNQQRNGASQQELNITRAKINELESLVGQIGR